MPMDERKWDDLLTVLAAVAAAVPTNEREEARALVDDDGRIVATDLHVAVGMGRSKEPSRILCGHELELVGGEKIMVGGGGVVIPCREARDRERPAVGADDGLGEVRYALKVSRPSLLEEPEQQKIEGEKADQEYEIHLPLAHQNIAKMYNRDRFDIPVSGAGMTKLTLPCTLIEWVEDATPFDEFVREKCKTPTQFADLLTQTCRALYHLHSAGMVHWDIKGDNLLVSGRGEVKLMDLGNARSKREAGETYKEAEQAESTYGNLPPKLHARQTEPADIEVDDSGRVVSRNRAPCELKANEEVWDRPWLDLHMLAREVNRIIGFDVGRLVAEYKGEDHREPAAYCTTKLFVGEEGEFVLNYLHPLLDRLLLADSPTAPFFYGEAGEVVKALERLLPAYGAGTDIPELQVVPQHVLRVPPAENIPWTERIQALMGSDTVLGLKKHRQLATVRHVYPGAEHTRWEHTIGALGRVLQAIRALYADRHSILFRLDTSELDLTAIMVATLLHDVGHPAFGHQLEESPLITPDRRHEAYALELLRAARAAAEPERADAAEVRTVLEDHWCSPGIDVETLLTRTIELLEGSFEDEPVNEDRRVHLELLHTLLAGPLDADKSDYLARDAHHCGVEYATGIDRKRLDQSLTALEVIEQPPGATSRRTAMLGINRKGVLPLESMLVARYQLFRAVYWHHTVRAITVMLQELVEGYVLPRAEHAAEGHRERLDLLQGKFRDLPDEQAIAWLAEEVDGLPIPPREKGDLTFLAKGVLGHRANFPWQGVELFGTEDETRETYLDLGQEWSRGAGEDDGIQTVRNRRELRRRLAVALEEEFDNAGMREIEIGEADVLLDVPVEGKDQVKDLYVAGAHGSSPQTVDSVTPIARAVAKAFKVAVRPVRVFLRPEVAESIGSGTSAEAKLNELIRTSLRNTVTAYQLELSGAGDRPS